MMIDEQFQFRLSQYFDETLPVAEAASFFNELASNREAIAVLDEYRLLDLTMKSAEPLPAVNWDALAEQISGHIDEASASRMRLRFTAPMRSAIAAAVVLAVGVGTWLTLKSTGPTPLPAPVEVSQIQGPQIETAVAAAVSDIEIGPARGFAAEQPTAYYHADLTPRPSRVVIASSIADGQDDRRSPY